MKNFIKSSKPFIVVLFGWMILYSCFFIIHCERAMEPPTVYEGQQAYLAEAIETPSFVFLAVGFRRDKTIGLSDAAYVQYPPDVTIQLLKELPTDDNHQFLTIKYKKEDLKKHLNKASFSLILSQKQNKWIDIDPKYSDIWMPKIGNEGNIGRVCLDFTTKIVWNYNKTKFISYLDQRETDDW